MLKVPTTQVQINLTSALVQHESAPVLGPWSQKDELVKQRVLARILEEENLSPLEEGTGNSGGLKACCDITHEENEKGQSPART